MNRFQRPEATRGSAATALELFYDLVFVFAVTQVSYVLLSDLDMVRSGPGTARSARRLVGVDVHHVGDERARHRLDSRPVRVARNHVREPLDGGGDPRGVRESRSLSRLRRDSGRATHVPDSRGGGCGHDRAPTCEPNPCLVRGGRRVLDRGRLRRTGAAVALDGGARDRLQRAALPLLGAGSTSPRKHIVDVETSHFAERFQLFIIIASARRSSSPGRRRQLSTSMQVG